MELSAELSKLVIVILTFVARSYYKRNNAKTFTKKESATEIKAEKLGMLSLAFFTFCIRKVVLLCLFTFLFSCKKEHVEHPLMGIWQAETYYYKHVDEYHQFDIERTSHDVTDSSIGYKTIILQEDGSLEVHVNDMYLSSDDDSEIYLGTYTITDKTLEMILTERYVNGDHQLRPQTLYTDPDLSDPSQEYKIWPSETFSMFYQVVDGKLEIIHQDREQIVKLSDGTEYKSITVEKWIYRKTN